MSQPCAKPDALRHTAIQGQGTSLTAARTASIRHRPETRFQRKDRGASPRPERAPDSKRNIVEPTGNGTFGLPMGPTGSATITHFEDMLDLRPGTSYYSVVPLGAGGEQQAGNAGKQGTDHGARLPCKRRSTSQAISLALSSGAQPGIARVGRP